MIALRTRQIWLGLLFGLVLSLWVAAVPAQASEPDDPLFLFRPLRAEDPDAPPVPPPFGDFEGVCGLAVNSTGNFYVSDYQHHAIDLFGPSKAYGGQIAGVEPLDLDGLPVEKDDLPVDGPCGLAFDGGDVLYANVYHRSVVKFTSFPMEAKDGVVITGAPVDSEHPTGVATDPSTNNVFVNDRTHVAVFDSAGAPLGSIGAGSIGDAHGLAVSGFTSTLGQVYVPDAATNTVKVFNPTPGPAGPVATIDGHETPEGKFISLRDSAVAVDRVSGEVYIADNLQPEDTERPETAIYVFTAAGAYEGRLKYNIVNAWPPGLAVDNSATATQGRVYVSTENSERAAIFAYPPHAATSAALPALPLPAQKTGEIEEEPWNEEVENVPALAPSAAVSAAAVASVGDQAAQVGPKSSAKRPRHKRRAKKTRLGSAGNRQHNSKRGNR